METRGQDCTPECESQWCITRAQWVTEETPFALYPQQEPCWYRGAVADAREALNSGEIRFHLRILEIESIRFRNLEKQAEDIIYNS